MKCECPYFSDNHKENECTNKAAYIVNRQYFDAAGFAVGDVKEVRVCPECKFPDDFNVREIKL
jgi:hypothetical protein